jgi:hypothetical protein
VVRDDEIEAVVAGFEEYLHRHRQGAEEEVEFIG